jgi:hypothetical protein
MGEIIKTSGTMLTAVLFNLQIGSASKLERLVRYKNCSLLGLIVILVSSLLKLIYKFRVNGWVNSVCQEGIASLIIRFQC